MTQSSNLLSCPNCSGKATALEKFIREPHRTPINSNGQYGFTYATVEAAKKDWENHDRVESARDERGDVPQDILRHASDVISQHLFQKKNPGQIFVLIVLLWNGKDVQMINFCHPFDG
ncbi:hypothetical protein EBZ80_02190 [bacterium]|nr:hypothetical protein [bacterium]